jgi:hypothetical protein
MIIVFWDNKVLGDQKTWGQAFVLKAEPLSFHPNECFHCESMYLAIIYPEYTKYM